MFGIVLSVYFDCNGAVTLVTNAPHTGEDNGVTYVWEVIDLLGL